MNIHTQIKQINILEQIHHGNVVCLVIVFPFQKSAQAVSLTLCAYMWAVLIATLTLDFKRISCVELHNHVNTLKLPFDEDKNKLLWCSLAALK